jgi:DNA-binding beta-propeller fold protein YncE
MRSPPPSPAHLPRRSAPTLLLALAAVPFVARADAAAAHTVYVLNSGEASVMMLDSVSREETRRIPVLREAHHIVLTPDRRSLVVADSGGNELLFLEPGTGELQRRERISNPYHLEYSPDGKLLVIASLRRDQVDFYDANGPTLLQRLRVGDKPSHITFSPDSRMVYVTLQGQRSVVAISLETRQPVWYAEVGREPAGILWHRGKLIVGIMGADHFAVLDPETRQVERTIQVGRGAHTIFASPDRRVLYATSRVDSRLTVLDAQTLEVLHRWDLPGGPDCIAFDPQGRLWITLRWIQRIAVVDPQTAQIETIRVGRSPHGIFVQPAARSSGG